MKARPSVNMAVANPTLDPAVPSVSHLEVGVGQRVRQRRKAAGLSLVEVSARTGLSIGYLSQLERGLSSATLKALTSLSDVLKVPLAGLLASQHEPGSQGGAVLRKARSHQVTMWGSGIRKALLAGHGLPGQGSFSFSRMTFVPGADSGLDPYAHEGYEAGYVEAGSVTLTLSGAVHQLVEGDSFQFPSTEPHRFQNVTNVPSVVVIVNIKSA